MSIIFRSVILGQLIILCQIISSKQMISSPLNLYHKQNEASNASRLKKEQNFLKRKIQSIKEYLFMLQEDAQSIQIQEKGWQSSFYRSQLKVALSINHLLINIVGEKENQIQDIFQQISQLKKKISRLQQEKQQFFSKNSITNENSHKDSNKLVNTPQRQLKQAFQAQRKIIGAKHTQQKEQYEKLVQKKEQILKSNKQQNAYLRQKLISLGEKITLNEKQIKLMKRQNEQLKKRIKKVQNEHIQESCAKVLNFSPISNKNHIENDQIELFSFNHSVIEHSQDEDLKKQIVQLKQLLKIQEEQYCELQKQITSMSKNKYYQELERDCVKLTNQISEKNDQIAQYRAIFADINENGKHLRTMKQVNQNLEKQIEKLKQIIQQYHLKDQKNELQSKKCQECQTLLSKNHNLSEQLQISQQEISTLKHQLKIIIDLVIAQEKEWEIFFSQSGLKPGKS